MHPNHSRLMFASLGLCAVGLAALTAFQSEAQPQPPPVQLSKWLQSTPVRALPTCSTASPGTAEAPYFTFNGGTYDACWIDGPYRWENKSWFVLRQKGFLRPQPGSTKADIVRLCSAQAAHPTTPDAFVAGPCRTTKGVGPAGCEVCAVNVEPQP